MANGSNIIEIHYFQCGIDNEIQNKLLKETGKQAMTRNQIPPSKPKREKTKIANSQNTKRKYGQSSEQFFPKRGPLSNQNRSENNLYKHKVKRHRN